MKKLLCVFLMIGSVGYCADLEIVESSIFLIKSEERELPPQTEQETTRQTMTFYTYRIVFYLKNTSDEELNVATRGLSIASSTSEIRLSQKARKVNGMLVIPPASDFAIVNLKPGECAMVRFKDTSTLKAEDMTIAYSPTDPYDGRFGYWTGMIKSSPIKIRDAREGWVEWDLQNSHWLQPGY